MHLRQLQSEVIALQNGTATASLRARALLWALLHYMTNARVPYVEHFPLESIYLVHRRKLLKRVSKLSDGDRTEECNELNRLIVDFDHPENETLEDLKLRRAEHCGDSRDVYNRPLDFSQQLRDLAIIGPKAYACLVSIALVAFIGIVLGERYLGLNVQVPFELSTTRVVGMYFVCLGLVVGGLVVLDRINPVLAKAQAHRLYVDASDNRSAAEIALRVRGRFLLHSGMDYAIAGATLLSLVFLVTPLPLSPELSVLELTATAVAAVLSLLILYPLATIYSIYANASVALQGLPQRRFRLDLHAGDGRSGVGDLVDLLVSGIVFNATALILLWVVGPIALRLIPASGNWWAFAVYQILIYPIALFRVTQLRRLWGVRRSLASSVQQAIAEEASKLPSLPVAERNARHHNIERTRSFPILTNAARGRVKELVIVVLVPLAMLAGDKIFTAWSSVPVTGP